MGNVENKVWSNDPFIQKEMEFFMGFELDPEKNIPKEEKKYSNDYFINKEMNFFMGFEKY
jgi:hypothetical protein